MLCQGRHGTVTWGLSEVQRNDRRIAERRVARTMRLLRRRPPRTETDWPAGDRRCTERGCPSREASACAYRDRRGRLCPTAFCPTHWATVRGVVYCRRHAGTVIALGPATEAGALPELDNRGPSLTNWVADDISDDVVALLRSIATDREAVRTEALVAVVYDHQRRRRWERSWKLAESTGVSIKVAVAVSDDDDDGIVELRVGSTVVARGIPPWIARRRSGVRAASKAESDQRELFHLFCMNHIGGAITAQRRERDSLSA